MNAKEKTAVERGYDACRAYLRGEKYIDEGWDTSLSPHKQTQEAVDWNAGWKEAWEEANN